jgi:hypothetical protein
MKKFKGTFKEIVKYIIDDWNLVLEHKPKVLTAYLLYLAFVTLLAFWSRLGFVLSVYIVLAPLVVMALVSIFFRRGLYAKHLSLLVLHCLMSYWLIMMTLIQGMFLTSTTETKLVYASPKVVRISEVNTPEIFPTIGIVKLLYGDVGSIKTHEATISINPKTMSGVSDESKFNSVKVWKTTTKRKYIAETSTINVYKYQFSNNEDKNTKVGQIDEAYDFAFKK